jgi:copper chaperone CopZ
MNHIYFFLITFIVLLGCQKKQEDLQTTVINTPTIVCGSCEKIVKKALYASDAVQDVKVDLDKKIIEVRYRPQQTNVETLEQLIADAGYDANDRKRDPTAYENLPECCKFDKGH